ncbi:heavy-metal-associated domain-containing protein [Actinophytocola xanthii]|uniref:Cation-transporting ATPase n=1 Tax=Actinophytocola xanthii TaxID=1912961 RepID=A0A1Q8CGG7_9PSEU|nr:heavy-metal-associated domain-containing protein [Actinophytocola xanthii]OLF13410.1 cation-transporting ATPase [Actinophytocola xanthii]
MTTSTFTVTGMTCQHCVGAVREEVSRIPGVTGVDVDLASGRVTVTSEGPVATEDVRASVDEAGYELAS